MGLFLKQTVIHKPTAAGEHIILPSMKATSRITGGSNEAHIDQVVLGADTAEVEYSVGGGNDFSWINAYVLQVVSGEEDDNVIKVGKSTGDYLFLLRRGDSIILNPPELVVSAVTLFLACTTPSTIQMHIYTWGFRLVV